MVGMLVWTYIVVLSLLLWGIVSFVAYCWWRAKARPTYYTLTNYGLWMSHPFRHLEDARAELENHRHLHGASGWYILGWYRGLGRPVE